MSTNLIMPIEKCLALTAHAQQTIRSTLADSVLIERPCILSSRYQKGNTHAHIEFWFKSPAYFRLLADWISDNFAGDINLRSLTNEGSDSWVVKFDVDLVAHAAGLEEVGLEV